MTAALTGAQREEAILAIAGEYTDDHGTPAAVRGRFRQALGRSDEEPPSLVTYDMAERGVFRITVEYRSAFAAGRLIRFLHPDGDHKRYATTPDGRRVLVNAPALIARRIGSIAGRNLHQANRRRGRFRASSAVARVLAIHYLSRTGGGDRTLEEAARLVAEAGICVPDGWRNERQRVIRQIREEYGPV